MNLPDIHLFVATPCYGGLVHQGYMKSMIALLQTGPGLGFEVTLELPGYDSNVTRGRNTLAAKFFNNGSATHRLFVDARSRAEAGEALDSAASRYLGYLCEGVELESREGFVTGLYAGAGFLLIRRPVLTRMIAAFPGTRYTAVHTRPEPGGGPDTRCSIA